MGALKNKELIGYLVCAFFGFLVADSEAGSSGGGFKLVQEIFCAYGFAGILSGWLFMQRRRRARLAQGEIHVTVDIGENARFMRWVSEFMTAMIIGVFQLPFRVLSIIRNPASPA
jgi:hypothetical protein